MFELGLGALGVLVTVVALAALAAGVWLRVAGDREGGHWPDGLDEDSTLDVMSHVGDSRPIR